MLQRAYYLRSAINQFINEYGDDGDRATRKIKEKLLRCQVTAEEWNQIALLLKILHPFKATSAKLQSTTRPRIDQVFWSYEILFNNMESIQTKLRRARSDPWSKLLLPALDKMWDKLQSYYSNTDKPFVYPDAVMLEPNGKLVLFDQPTLAPYKDQYKADFRNRFEEDYATSAQSSEGNEISRKRKVRDEDADIDYDDDDYFKALARAKESIPQHNEVDTYLDSPPLAAVGGKKPCLPWWKSSSKLLPGLARMLRDTHAVPATGAGVERQFSKSGKVANFTRARLNHKTITESMLYKDMLFRHGELARAQRYADDDDDSTDDEDEDDFDMEWEPEMECVQHLFENGVGEDQ